MENMFSFLLWVGLTVFMICVVRDVQSRIQERARLLRPNESNRDAKLDILWVPPEKDVDPVCAKTVTTAKAKPSVHAGLVYYFCSRECREVFEAAPDFYIDAHHGSLPELEHSHA